MTFSSANVQKIHSILLITLKDLSFLKKHSLLYCFFVYGLDFMFPGKSVVQVNIEEFILLLLQPPYNLALHLQLLVTIFLQISLWEVDSAKGASTMSSDKEDCDLISQADVFLDNDILSCLYLWCVFHSQSPVPFLHFKQVGQMQRHNTQEKTQNRKSIRRPFYYQVSHIR